MYVINTTPIFVKRVESEEEGVKLADKGILIMAAEDLEQVPLSGLVKLYNGAPGIAKKIGKFRDKKVASERTFEVLDRYVPEKTVKTKSKTKAPRAPREAGDVDGRSPYAGMTLTKVADSNPRREGTHGWESWNAFRSGSKYETAIEAGARPRDLNHDIKSGRIKVSK